MTDIGLEAAGMPARGAAAPRDLAMFFRQFSTILNAGLPVDRALDLLSRDREDRTTAKLAEPLLQQVRMGTPLATAMTREGALFGPFAVSVTRAAEASGDLGHATGTLADHFEQRAALLDEIRSTLTYPAVLFAASALAVIVLFVVVVPQFEPLFDRSGADIPTTTATVLAISRWMVAWGGWTGIAIAVLVAGLMLPAAAPLRDRFVSASPLIGALRNRADAARWARGLATLTKAGVGLPEALSIVADAAQSGPIRAAAVHVANAILQGRSLAGVMAETGAFPTVAVQMVRVGEETGRLSEVLNSVADLIGRDVKGRTKRLVALIEPVLILVLGLAVALVVMALLTTVTSLNEAVT